MVKTRTNALLVIDGLINEHAAISGHMRSVCSLLDQWDSHITEKTVQSGQEDLLSQRGINLKQTMGYLEDGLRQHHQLEEAEIPAIAGDMVMEALRIEHNEIIKQLREINFILRDIQPKTLAANFDYLKLIINNLCSLISLHCSVENTLLNLMRKRFI